MFFSSDGVSDGDIIPLVTERMEAAIKLTEVRKLHDIIKRMFPSHAFLDRINIPYSTATFPSSTPKGASNVAIALGLREHQTIKTLIFETDKDERVLVMVGGDQNVISGHLKKVLGSRNIQLASPDKVIQTTGYQIGSIPPFSWQPDGFRSFLDMDMMNEVILAVGAGIWGNEIFISPTNLVTASQSMVVNLTDREKPVFL
jgi:Cys-tRNA(Pro)/Cys-tRNA(Cys) deacylase